MTGRYRDVSEVEPGAASRMSRPCHHRRQLATMVETVSPALLQTVMRGRVDQEGGNHSRSREARVG